MLVVSPTVRRIGATFLLLAVTLSPRVGQAFQAPSDDEPATAETLFSGPQPGEPLPAFEVQALLAEQEKRLQPLETFQQGPYLLIFVHKLSRPTIALARGLADLAAELKPQVPVALVFLSDDPTDTQQWGRRAKQALPQNTLLAVSTEGIEGPGAYGLNRQVAMTVLVGRNREVTDNFTLVQPSTASDGPRIARALSQAAEAPLPEDWRARLNLNRRETESDRLESRIRPLLRPLLNRDASAAEIKTTAARIEQAMQEDPALNDRIVEICQTIVRAEKLENYGNEHAQAVLKRWSERTDMPR